MTISRISFAEKRQLQRLIIEQNKVIASETASQAKKDEASRIKADALLKLGVVPEPATNP